MHKVTAQMILDLNGSKNTVSPKISAQYDQGFSFESFGQWTVLTLGMMLACPSLSNGREMEEHTTEIWKNISLASQVVDTVFLQ